LLNKSLEPEHNRRTVLLLYGLGNSKIRFHSYSENIVLRVDSKESVKGCHIFALRIYNLSFTETEIETSTKWMQALCRHTEVTAQMHGFSASHGRASANGLPEMEWNARLTAIGDGSGLIPYWADQPVTFFSKKESRIIGQTAHKALAAIQSFDKGKEYGVIHGDLHQWNYMFHQGEVRV
jgi:Ser/Thr protein kinase RdoA (MazF antagonist)